MSESLFQILLLIAYLAIALISVVIATYAVAVSYLGIETRRAIWRMKKRRKILIEKLEALVRERATTGRVREEVKEEIKKSEKEEKELRDRLFFLSKNGAVFLPCFLYFNALALVAYGIYMDLPETLMIMNIRLSELLVWLAISLIGMGILSLAITLREVESAALRIPLPEFKVSFASLISSEEYKAGEKKEVPIIISNNGDDIAEDIKVFVNFPPEFEVHRKPPYTVFKQGPETDYHNYFAAIYAIKLLHIDTSMYTSVLLTMPKKIGSYVIPVNIYERKIGVTKEHQLTLEIVS